MQGFFKKKFPLPKFKREEMEETVCFIFISFAISKSFIPKFLTFCGKNYGLLSKTSKPMCFQSMQYGYEIFETVLSLKCTIT